MLDLKDKSWRELCEAASREHDPQKLLELVTALNDALEKLEEEKANGGRVSTQAAFSRPCTMSIVAAHKPFACEGLKGQFNGS